MLLQVMLLLVQTFVSGASVVVVVAGVRCYSFVEEDLDGVEAVVHGRSCLQVLQFGYRWHQEW